MTNLIEPPAPQSGAHPCRACGTWVCDDCGARRFYASRFSSPPQGCATCAGTNGYMAPVIHRESRADDHDASYRRSLVCAAPLRYPFEDA
jgi:hypothetical protein